VFRKLRQENRSQDSSVLHLETKRLGRVGFSTVCLLQPGLRLISLTASTATYSNSKLRW
jgi:hypothetical protein